MQTWTKGALQGVALIVLLAVAGAGSALAGQRGSDTAHPSVPAVNDPWPEVNLNVVVLNKQGAPQAVDVTGFQLFEDKSERPLHFRATADSPVSIAFLIDTSGSMYQRRELHAAAIKEIVNSLPAGSEVMAILFADQAYIDLPFTPVSSIDYSFLDRLEARGGTTLYDTVIVAEKYFVAHARYARRAIVLFSDGGDNESKSRREDAIRSIEGPGAPTFYSFFIPDARTSITETGRETRAMEDFAKAGGGVALTPRQKDFAPAVTRLADMIRSQYVLHFTAADPTRDGKAHKLEVRLPVKDLQIHALPVYYAPAK